MPLFPTFPAYNDATNNIGGKVGNVVGGIGGTIFGGPLGSYAGGLLGRGIGAGVEDIGGWFGRLLAGIPFANLFSGSSSPDASQAGQLPSLPTDSQTNNPPMYGAAAVPPTGSSAPSNPGLNLFSGFNSYLQGTTNGYGGGSALQLAQSLRGTGIDPSGGGFDSYAAPWNLASGYGASTGGGGGSNQGPTGANAGWRVA